MKKMFGVLATALLIGLGQAHAVKLEAQYRMWKTSTTQSTDVNVIMTTAAPIILHSIVVDSPTVNTDPSFIAVYNATMSVFTAGLSTKAFCNLNSGALTTPPGEYPFDIILSSFSMYHKQGVAKIRILWDYLIPPPQGSLPDLR